MTLITITIISSNVFASDISSILEAGQDFFRIGDYEEKTLAIDSLITSNSNIFNILLAVAIIIAVVVGVVLGIQFMTSSVEGQAKIKEAIVPYLIGCVVVFAAFPIWKMVVGVGESTETGIYTKEAGIKLAQEQIEQFEKKGTYGDLVNLYQNYAKNDNTNDYYGVFLDELMSVIISYAKKAGVYHDYLAKGIIEGFVVDSNETKNLEGVRVDKDWYNNKWLPLLNTKISEIK